MFSGPKVCFQDLYNYTRMNVVKRFGVWPGKLLQNQATDVAQFKTYLVVDSAE